MPEGKPPSLEQLLKVTPAQRAEEVALGNRGFVSERYIQIEKVEVARMQNALETTLQERVTAMTPENIEQRRQTVDRYLREQLLPPSFENGPYAAAHWRNLFEMTDRIVDMEQATGLVPEVDARVPFTSFALERRAIVNGLLGQRIQGTLGEGNRLTQYQLYDCFTNVSQEQIDAVVDQIAHSGLPIRPESPKEHWARIAKGLSSEGAVVRPPQASIGQTPTTEK